MFIGEGGPSTVMIVLEDPLRKSPRVVSDLILYLMGVTGKPLWFLSVFTPCIPLVSPTPGTGYTIIVAGMPVLSPDRQ
jgi:hypothetical protein